MRGSGVLLVLLGASITLNVVLFLRKGEAPPSAPAAAAATEAVAPASAVAADAPEAPAAEAPAAAPVAGDWTVVRTTVEHSIARTMAAVAGEHGDALSAELARLFVWDVDMNRDLQKGDALELAWRLVPPKDYQVAVARFTSGKLGKTFTAYRYQQQGDDYPSYWRPDGTEVPLFLVDGPLKQYEQITSLLKDRPTHKGMDFKVNTGTPVYAPKDGTVLRTNWNWSSNGNCVELQLEDGTIAKFLHLSDTKVKAGERVARGDVIALTGNTGHTTAPHLHYQLERGEGKIVDPLDYHRTDRRALGDAARAAFDAEARRLDALLAATP